jgi:hypothetical protein
MLDFIEQFPNTINLTFDVSEGDPIHARLTIIRPSPAICCFQHIASIDSIIENIEPEIWLLLGFIA